MSTLLWPSGLTPLELRSYLVAIASVTGLISWLVILITYLRFFYGARRQGIDRNEFPYRAPFQPWASYAAAFMITVIVRAPLSAWDQTRD